MSTIQFALVHHHRIISTSGTDRLGTGRAIFDTDLFINAENTVAFGKAQNHIEQPGDIMNKIMQAGAVLFFTPLLAFAGTSHELTGGLNHDSSSEEVSEDNSQVSFIYSYFLSPLTHDAPHIDLRKFYQHPSQLGAGLASITSETEDSSNPASVVKTKMSADMVMLGAEYYLPSDTGLLIALGSGSGSLSASVGSFETKADIDLNRFELGLRQFAARNVAFQIRTYSEEYTGDLTGVVQGPLKEKRSVVLLGTQAVIKDTVGFMFEVGRGDKEGTSPFTVVAGTPDTYDVAEVKTALTFYSGERFSILLGVDLDGQFQTEMPAGYRHEITKSKVRLVPRYWFSDSLGLEVGIYSVNNEEVNDKPLTSSTTKTKSSGALLNLGYRF